MGLEVIEHDQARPKRWELRIRPQNIDIIDKTVKSDGSDGPDDVLQPYSSSDLDGDAAEREAIMEVDGTLDVPEFLKRTSCSGSEA